MSMHSISSLADMVVVCKDGKVFGLHLQGKSKSMGVFIVLGLDVLVQVSFRVTNRFKDISISFLYIDPF